MAGTSSDDNRNRFLRWLVGLPRTDGEIREASGEAEGRLARETARRSEEVLDAPVLDEALAARLVELERELEAANERAAIAEERARRAEARIARLEEAVARTLFLWFGEARHRAAEDLAALHVEGMPVQEEGVER